MISLSSPPTEEALIPPSLTAPDSSFTPPSSPSHFTFNRLSLPFSVRTPLATTGGFLAGAALGFSHGSATTGLRFRAENAHRLPKSQKGWYFYHKSKNYTMMLGGAKEGLKMGSRIGLFVSGFVVVEEAVDRLRGGRIDFMSTVIAGLGAAGVFSAWNRFPLVTAARMAKTGLLTGLGYGLVQDALGLARGRRLDYVDFLLGIKQGREGDE